jgi:hypothetical protein
VGQAQAPRQSFLSSYLRVEASFAAANFVKWHRHIHVGTQAQSHSDGQRQPGNRATSRRVRPIFSNFSMTLARTTGIARKLRAQSKR